MLEKRLVASIMTADQMHLKVTLDELVEAKINWLHCDVMDGVFVNNLAMGPYQIEALKKDARLILDVHLATVNPEHYIRMFGPLQPDYITFHIETTENPEELFQLIRSYNCKVGLAFSPDTPVTTIEPYLKDIDLLLVMTVNPGFAGQEFISNVLNKLEKLTEIFSENNFERPLIEVDGNIYDQTIRKMTNFDVDLFVLGTSALFNEDGQSINDKSKYLREVLSES
ncbi:ribulose-phosphate 3-epimerase [Hutsoniella sourekii]